LPRPGGGKSPHRGNFLPARNSTPRSAARRTLQLAHSPRGARRPGLRPLAAQQLWPSGWRIAPRRMPLGQGPQGPPPPPPRPWGPLSLERARIDPSIASGRTCIMFSIGQASTQVAKNEFIDFFLSASCQETIRYRRRNNMSVAPFTGRSCDFTGDQDRIFWPYPAWAQTLQRRTYHVPVPLAPRSHERARQGRSSSREKAVRRFATEHR